MRAGDAGDPVAKGLNHVLDVHRYERFILDDHDVCRHLAGNLHRRGLEQLVEAVFIDIENLRCLGRLEALDRNQQESLARLRCYRFKICGSSFFPAEWRRIFRNWNRKRIKEL